MLSQFDRACTACSLSCKEAVMATPPPNLADVMLIVLSDYPGYYERKHNKCMVSNDALRFRNPAMPERRNAGSLMRHMIREVYTLNDQTQVYYSNALKCDPKEHAVAGRHLQLCASAWLIREFDWLDTFAPTVPLLAAGNHAAKALRLLDPTVQLSSANAGRRRLWYVRQHPTVVTFNPAAIARSEMRLVTHERYVAKFSYPQRTTTWDPPLVGSAPHLYIQDLLLLKPYLSPQKNILKYQTC